MRHWNEPDSVNLCSRPTPRNGRWRRGGRAPPRGAGLKATRGRGKRESAAGAHRGISPPEASQHRGGPTARPGRRTGAPDTLTGAHAHRHRHTPESRSRPGRTLSRRAPAAHPRPRHAQGSPAPPRLGDATGRRRPGDDTHVRRGRLGPRQGTGARGGRTRGTRRRGRQRRGGAGKHARRGPRDRGAGAVRGPEKHREHGRATRKTSAGSHRHPHTRAVPRHAWDADRSRLSPERAPTTRPHHQGRGAARPIFLHPSSTDPSSI